MTALAIALAYSGFTALCLAMEKHQLELYGKQRAGAQRMRAWRIVGWTLLGIAFAGCVHDTGWGLGPVVWLGALTVSGLFLAYALLPYRPRWIAPLAWTLPVIGLAMALL